MKKTACSVFLLILAASSAVLAGDGGFAAANPFPSAAAMNSAPVPPASPAPVLPGSQEDYPSLKTRAQTFNAGYYARVRDGGIQVRPNYERTGKDGPWEQLAIPAEAGRIREISADGDNLMAVSEAGRVFYMKFSSRKWAVKLGKPFGKELYLPANRAWAVSHLGKEVGGHYEDPDGKSISNSAGVSTLYVLSPDGTGISYIDPWLPAAFNHHVPTPLRGRFAAEALSASASTIFLIGGSGRMFTRLADFDTLGCDPALAYSYESTSKPGVIKLPAEDWREQPAIAGRITAGITIAQNGRGNAARELRVEGVDADGNGGYYSKLIYGAEWSFVKTGAAVTGPFLGGADETGPELDGDYALDYRRLPEGALLKGFSPLNSTAQIVVPGLESAPLTLHTRETVLPAGAGKPRNFYGAVEIPAALYGSSDPAAKRLVKELGGKRFREVRVIVFNGRVTLRDSRLGLVGRALQLSRISDALDA